MSILDRGSSPIDWCEPNYQYHPSIAEFTNTISNVTFVVLAPIFSCLFMDYASRVNPWVNLIWSLFVVVGLSSAYFHATLSLLGQMLDELSILWLLSAAFAMWTPKRAYPRVFRGSRSDYQKFIFVLTITLTILAWMWPEVNAFFLVSAGIPSFYLLSLEYRRCKDRRVRRLALRCTFCWAVAMTCWIGDRLLCDLLRSSLGLVYLHAFFHVSIAYTSFTLCVLFAYFDAVNEHHDLRPAMKFWPSDSFVLGLPYVAVK